MAIQRVSGSIDKMIARIICMDEPEKLGLILGFTARRIAGLTHTKPSDVLRRFATMMEEMGQ